MRPISIMFYLGKILLYYCTSLINTNDLGIYFSITRYKTEKDYVRSVLL